MVERMWEELFRAYGGMGLAGTTGPGAEFALPQVEPLTAVAQEGQAYYFTQSGAEQFGIDRDAKLTADFARSRGRSSKAEIEGYYKSLLNRGLVYARDRNLVKAQQQSEEPAELAASKQMQARAAGTTAPRWTSGTGR